MRELEASLQQSGDFLLNANHVTEKAAPYRVRWVRRFITLPASTEPLADQVRRFCEELQKAGTCQDWQIRQAEHALRIYFVNFLQRTGCHRQQQTTLVDERRMCLNLDLRVVRADHQSTSGNAEAMPSSGRPTP